MFSFNNKYDKSKTNSSDMSFINKETTNLMPNNTKQPKNTNFLDLNNKFIQTVVYQILQHNISF